MAELDLIALGGIVLLLLYAFNRALPFKGPLDVRGDEEVNKDWRPISTV